MGEVEAKKDEVTGYELRHDRHTVSLLTDHLVFSPKYSVGWIAKRIKGRSSKLLRDQFPQLKGWCPGLFYADFPSGNQILQSKIGQYWAPSCYHKTFQKSFINKLLEKVWPKMLRCFAISRAWLGTGWEVYIGAEGLREGRYCSGDRRIKGKT